MIQWYKGLVIVTIVSNVSYSYIGPIRVEGNLVCDVLECSGRS